MSNTWSVLVMFEGPTAEARARALIATSCGDPAVGYVSGGPGITDWDIGNTGPGWETHSYDRGQP